MPEKIIHVDFTRFNSAGFGTVHGGPVVGLRVGEIVALTDDEADTVEGEVVEVHGDIATVRARWDRVLHEA